MNKRTRTSSKAENSKISDQKNKELLIFLACLPKTIKESDIRKIFSKFGKIKYFRFEVKYQEKANSHLRNAIITCSDLKMKSKILHNTHYFNKVKLRVSNYLSNEELNKLKESVKSRRIYIRKLPNKFENSDLKKIFSIYGEIEEAYCAVGTRSRKNLKYGYVMFKDTHFIPRLPVNGINYKGWKLEWETYYTRLEKKMSKQENPEVEFNTGNGLKINHPDRHELTPLHKNYHVLFGENWYSSENLLLRSSKKEDRVFFLSPDKKLNRNCFFKKKLF